jgi:hypothetical protein
VIPATAGAAIAAEEVVPPSRALAEASWVRGTMWGSNAVLAGPEAAVSQQASNCRAALPLTGACSISPAPQ